MSSPPTVADLASSEAYDAWTRANASAVVHFYASWCEPCAAMDALMLELAKAHHASGAAFARCDAEAAEDACAREGVTSVPYFVFYRDGRRVDAHEGADAAVVTNKSKQYFASRGAASTTPAAASREPVALNDRIKSMLAAQDVILFMKGTRTEPRCGFSSKVVAALDATGVAYETFNILEDEAIRQGLKAYSDWPTYPQLYYKSELLGGCDIVLEMAADGSLAAELGAKA